MSDLNFNLGLQHALDRWAQINGPPSALTGIGVDDSLTAFTSASTSLNGTNVHAKAFEVTPTRSAQEVTSQVFFGTADANGFTHRRFALTYATMPDTATPVPNCTAGVDSVASIGVLKTSAFALRYYFHHSAANAGTGNNLFVNQGLQSILDLMYGIGSLTKVASLGVDDGASAYAAGNTTFAGTAAAYSRVFSSTPTRSAQTLTLLASIPRGTAGQDMNGHTMTRINLNSQASNVAETGGSISGLYAGVSNQQFPKSTTQQYDFTMNVVATSA